MKRNKLIIASTFVIVAVLAIFLIITTSSKNQANNNNNTENIQSLASEAVDSSDYIVAHSQLEGLPIEELSSEESNGLIIMREEEKLAHDVYITLYERWGLNTFSNIAKSELTHTESIRYLIERYALEDPVKENTVGNFSNPIFTKLYTDLVAQGSKSLGEALIVGATIEDLDIKDLNELSAQVNNQDILEIYDNLTRGSRNHLRSFTKQLQKQGLSYSAQYLTQAEIDAIISSSQERGENAK